MAASVFLGSAHDDSEPSNDKMVFVMASPPHSKAPVVAASKTRDLEEQIDLPEPVGH